MENYMVLYRCKEQHNTNEKQHGGKFMDIKSYADVLRFAIKMQINYIEEDEKDLNTRHATEYFEGYYEGMKRGLEMALEKIDASMFLAEK
jgi:hypothetical protein